MRWTSLHPAPFSLLRVELSPGERLVADAGTMVARDAGVRLGVALDVGRARGLWARIRALVAAVVRKLLGGDHAFLDRFDAPAAATGWVQVAPAFAGPIEALEVREGLSWTLAPGALLAAGPGVHLEVRRAGLAAWLSREAGFWVEASGEGDLFVAGRGALDRIAVEGPHVVEADHLVAFSSGVSARAPGPRGGSLWSRRAEPLRVELSGSGTAWVQARGNRALIARLTPLLPE